MEPTEGKRLVILVSDNPKLARSLALNLERQWEVCWAGSQAEGQPQLAPAGQTPHLIIVALSLDESEALVVLAQAALSQYIGQIPLLIISDRPFAADHARRMAHLSFPFSPRALEASIRRLEDASIMERGKEHE